MRIKRVSVGRYKNLHDFECKFLDSNISAFIGSNGSGKSNLLEVITKAFSNAKNYASGKDLPLSLEPVLACVIEYELHGADYVLQYNHDVESILVKRSENPSIPIRGEISICYNGKPLAKKDIDNALPDSILLYYAGETLRQKGAAESTYDNLYEEKLKRAKSVALPSLCFMDYYSIGDLPLLLLTAAVYKGNYYAKFLSFVNCVEIAPKFSFILKNPGKGKGSADTYWNATGFVKYFLDSARRFVTGTRDSGGHQYYMFFNGCEGFRSISENEFDLFAKEIVKDPTAYESWHTALSSVNAIYLIVDRENGRQYVGSAYGKDGLLGRWAHYVDSLHGDNKLLKELLCNYPQRYKYFQFSILQLLPKTATPDDVIHTETLWKKKLLTYEPIGMNAN